MTGPIRSTGNQRQYQGTMRLVQGVDNTTKAANGNSAVHNTAWDQAKLGAGVLVAPNKRVGDGLRLGYVFDGLWSSGASQAVQGRRPWEQTDGVYTGGLSLDANSARIATRIKKGYTPDVQVSGSTSQQVSGAVLNVLAQKAGVNTVDPKLVKLLKQTPFVVVPDGKEGVGDAEYDARLNVVRVPESMMQQMVDAAGNLQHLQDTRADHHGKLTSAQQKQANDARHDLRSSLALLAHESTHAWQDRSGYAEQAMEYVSTLQDPKQRLHEYVRLVEFPAQRMQELAQFAMRDEPKKGEFLTLDDDGRKFTYSSSVKRMINAYGDEWGKALDQMMGPAGGANAAPQGNVTQMPGSEYYPGMKFPGMKFPGMKFPGMKFPGMKFPGMKFPGMKFPGMKFPGMKFPGMKFPGMKFPGMDGG